MQSTALFSLQNIFPVAFYFSLTRKFEKILFFSHEYRVLGKKISTIINSQGESCLGPFEVSPHPQMVCWRTAFVRSPTEHPQMFRTSWTSSDVQKPNVNCSCTAFCSFCWCSVVLFLQTNINFRPICSNVLNNMSCSYSCIARSLCQLQSGRLILSSFDLFS